MRTNKVPKVLFVIDRFINPYAGTEGQLYQLISALPRDRFEPELLVLETSAFIESGSMPCVVSVLGATRILDPRTWFKAWRFARRKKSEGVVLCHVFFNDASVICPPVFSSVGIPTIISRRDMGYWYTSKYLAVLRQTARWVSGVVANSEAVKSVTVAKEGYNPEAISVIYNGYPQTDSHGGAENKGEGKGSREEVRVALGFAETDSLFILAANLRPIKRIGDAIAALGQLAKKKSGIHLVIAGGGNSQAYQKLAEKVGVLDNVHFLGARDDVKSILPAMDVGVLCSQSEGYSNAIVEYMQAGLPVIASAVGGNVEAVEHGKTGYLYPVEEIQSLADHLAELLIVDTEKAAEMGSRGRELAMQRHGLNNMINAHCSLYERLRSKGQPNKAGPQ
jgi:glycosyltransferase involved in cell wall biosynthesis